jgi:hypothetical protein
MKLPRAETGMLRDGCGAETSVAGRCASVAGIPQHKTGGLEAPPLNPLPKVKEAFCPPALPRTVDAKNGALHGGRRGQPGVRLASIRY